MDLEKDRSVSPTPPRNWKLQFLDSEELVTKLQARVAELEKFDRLAFKAAEARVTELEADLKKAQKMNRRLLEQSSADGEALHAVMNWFEADHESTEDSEHLQQAFEGAIDLCKQALAGEGE